MTYFNENNFTDYKSQYKKNGYCIIRNVFTEDECNQIKQNSNEFAKLPDYPVVLNIHRKSDFFLILFQIRILSI